jgi:phosphoenolpyruvate-protein phosphotransferase (PTS system enzyme I)
MKKNLNKGTPLSPGIGYGKLLLLEKQHTPIFRLELENSQIEEEIQRFHKALEKTKMQLAGLKEQLSARLGEGHSYLMDAQIMMLDDQLLVAKTEDIIRKEGVNAEWALNETSSQWAKEFNNMKDKYWQERGDDVEDVANRIQANLSQIDVHKIAAVDEEVIVFSYQLNPSDVVELQNAPVVAFVTEVGGRTSHTAIIARSLEIPAVTGMNSVISVARSGQMVIVDGYEGIVILDPTPTQLREYQNKKRYYEEHSNILISMKDRPAITKDGRKIVVQANIELPDEIETAIKSGAQGIGIYRSEFLFLSNPDKLPTEDEHFQVYKNLAERVYPHSAIVRTADLGAEKFTPAMGMGPHREPNPALGIRGIRFCLQKKELFKIQLRALLRASVYGRLKIMFPMISGLSELREARATLEEAKEELRLNKLDFNENISVGIMVEVPSAGLTADLLAPEVDFFSIGTNDLIQYLLAVDRNNDHLSYLYDAMHPTVIRLMKFIVDKAHEAGVKVGLCGEMASDPQYALVLLGLGLDEVSMNPVAIPLIKQIVRSVRYSDARELFEHCLTLSTAQEINEYLLEKTNQFFPSGFFASRGPASIQDNT